QLLQAAPLTGRRFFVRGGDQLGFDSRSQTLFVGLFRKICGSGTIVIRNSTGWNIPDLHHMANREHLRWSVKGIRLRVAIKSPLIITISQTSNHGPVRLGQAKRSGDWYRYDTCSAPCADMASSSRRDRER
ncbi:MAG: hypothetical protein O3A92_13915, partial [Verrucomicrobia bacterium]|nr:hypothetical protein [Verrucomicrobiota bacterium]